jgi:cell division protein FtsZ
LREIYGNLSIRNAFGQADNILTTAAKGIAEIITVPGYVNVDFEDVKTVMCEARSAVMGSAMTDGENRARRAAEAALSSPLLNNMNIHGAEKILLSIMSGEQAELQMDELTEITDFIQEMAGEEADVIFGHGIDEEMGESISVTVIATGFDQSETKLPAKKGIEKKVYDLDSSRQINKNPEPPQQNHQAEQPKERITPKQPSLFEEDQPDEEPKEGPKEEEPVVGSRTYYFERPQQKINDEDDDSEMSQHKVGIDDYEFIDRIEEEQNEQIKIESAEEKSMKEIKLKREDLQRQAKERVDMIKKLNSNPYRQDDYKDKWNTPAYIRKNVNLQDVPHSADHNVSRYNLNDDNQILGNNKFLHDNVD